MTDQRELDNFENYVVEKAREALEYVNSRELDLLTRTREAWLRLLRLRKAEQSRLSPGLRGELVAVMELADGPPIDTWTQEEIEHLKDQIEDFCFTVVREFPQYDD